MWSVYSILARTSLREKQIGERKVCDATRSVKCSYGISSWYLAPYLLHNHPPQPFGSTKQLPPRHGIPSLPALPPSFPAPFLLTPLLNFFVPTVSSCETGRALHECNLALVLAPDPAVDAGVAVHEARGAGSGIHDRGAADGAECCVGGEGDSQYG